MKSLTISLIVVGVNFLKFFSPFESYAFSKDNENLYIQESHKNKEYLRTAIETTVVFGLTSVYYWGTQKFSDDFDYDVSFNTLGKKFSGEAIRFDDNDINANVGHTFAGAYYYLISRNHNLSRLESFLWSAVSSALFETFIEFQEVFSINDMIVTPFSGASLGEPMYQLGKYFRCSQNRESFFYKIMAAIADPVALVNSFIWKDVEYKFSEGNICMYTLIQSEFSIFSGISTAYYENTDRFKTGLVIGAKGKLYLLPYYGQESDIRKFVKDTVLVEIETEASIIDERVDSINIFAKTVWVAYHRQKITRDQEGNFTGYSFLAGSASAFAYTAYETDEFADWIGAVHILGPSLELTFFHKYGYVRFGMDIFGDFAMIRSFAFEKYKENHSLEGVKSVLQKEDYYYAFGMTVNPKVEIKHSSYRFAAEYKYSYYDSFEGADRRGHLTNDFNLVDTREEYKFSFGRAIDFIDVKFLKTHQIWAEVEVRRSARTGFIADEEVVHAGGKSWFILCFKSIL